MRMSTIVRADVARGACGHGGGGPPAAAAGRLRAPTGGRHLPHLPLAQRTVDKIERIIREEMDAIGGQEI